MASVSETLELAVRHHQAGRLESAETLYHEIVRLDPRHADALHLLAFRGHTLDLDALELHAGDRKYQLTQMECDLLAYLIRNAGKAVSRKAILEHVWAVHEDTDTRAIDNFIVRLRRYIEDDPAKPKLLLTVRSVGYKMAV